MREKRLSDGLKRLAPAWLEKAGGALSRLGVLGWVAAALALCGLWFVASALVLRSKAGRMEGDGPAPRVAAASSRSYGFGDRFLRSVLAPAKAGLVVREALDPAAKSVALVAGPRGVAEMAAREASRGHSRSTYRAAKTPCWLRLVRKEDTFRGFASADGARWELIEERSVGMASEALAGVMVCSPSAEPCEASFAELRVGPRGDEPPAWQQAEVGDLGAKGSYVRSGDGVVLKGKGGRVGGTEDAFYLLHARFVGDLEISARVDGPRPDLGLPDPLAGEDLARARLAVRANARASAVFGIFSLLLAASMRLFRTRPKGSGTP